MLDNYRPGYAPVYSSTNSPQAPEICELVFMKKTCQYIQSVFVKNKIETGQVYAAKDKDIKVISLHIL